MTGRQAVAPILVTGAARCLPGRSAELVRLLAAMDEASSRDPGCLYYAFARDLADPELYISIEVWASDAALQEHLAHGHTDDFLAAMPSLVAGSPTLVTRPLW